MAKERPIRARYQTFDARFDGRERVRAFLNRLLDVGVPPERIQVTESSYCDGTPKPDSVRVTVWYFHVEAVP